MKKNNTLFMTQAAMIAAIYVVLTLIGASIGFGPIQVRFAEALTILPFFTPAAIPGLFAGCLLANVLNGAIVLDVVFGSLATLIGAIGTYLLRKHPIMATIPPMLSNALIIPFVLKYGYGEPLSIPFMMLTIGIGEVISCGILGYGLLKILRDYRSVIFKTIA